jgi:hypothetical protein
MRPRAELALFAALLAVLTIAVTALGNRRRPRAYTDSRATTYSTEPQGTAGLAEALERVGVDVVRIRQARPRLADVESKTALAIVEPTRPLTAIETADLVGETATAANLILAGPRTRRLMRCFGFESSGWTLQWPSALGGSVTHSVSRCERS